MKNIFTDHPNSVGETYFQHMKFASHFGFNMLIGGLACLLHAVFPFLFVKTGSNVLLKMTHHFVERMPRIEGRVINLSRAIEQKMADTQVSLPAE
jgi:hypothetical protein